MKLALPLLLLALVLAGCTGEKDYGRTIPQNEPVNVQAEIDRIQNDPKMPQQAKDIAISQLKARQQNPDQGKTNP